MTQDETMALVAGLLCVVLAASALFGRRTSLGLVVRSVLGWAVIGGVLFFVVGHRDRIASAFRDLESWAGIGDQRVEGGMVRIRQSGDGHFWARVTIGGVTRRMLIDSGATTTAISDETARAIGLSYDRGDTPVMLETANGRIPAWRARVDRLSIDTLATDDLEVVISPNFGTMDVIGMNFLSRLKSWRVEGGVLILDPGGKPADAGPNSRDNLT